MLSMRVWTIGVIALPLWAATPSQALTVSANQAIISEADVGKSVRVNFLPAMNEANSLSASLVLTLREVQAVSATNQFVFDYRLKNTSGLTGADSKLRQFGFNLPGTVVAFGGPTDTYQRRSGIVIFDGLSAPEFCFSAAASCAGLSVAGLVPSAPEELGTINVRFINAPGQAVTFKDFVARWHVVGGEDTVSGVGSLSAVPEPATWAMMIGGFVMIGAAARRRQLSATYA